MVRHWHRLPKEAVDAPSLEVLKARLDGALSNLVSGRGPCPWQEGWSWMIYNVPSNPNHSVITVRVCKADLQLSYKSEDSQKEEWMSLCDQTAPAEVLASSCVDVNRITGLMGLSPELEQLLYLDVRSLPWEMRDLSFVSSLTP